MKPKWLALAAGALILACPPARAQSGIWDRRIEEDARRETFTLTARKPNYILVTSMSSPNQAPTSSPAPPTGSTARK